MASEEAAVAAVETDEAPQRRRYSPQEVLKQLSEIPDDKRTFSSSRLMDAITCQLQTIQAISDVKKNVDTATMADMTRIIMIFLKNIYNLVSGLPGALMFDALEDLMARTGLLAPFVNGMRRVPDADTLALDLGLPSREALLENTDELVRVAAAGIVCYYHYTNFPSHPDFFPSDDATLLFTSLALRSCQDKATAEALAAQLEAAGGVISLGEVRWLMHFFRAQLSGLAGSVFLSLGNQQLHKQQLVAQQADFLGLLKAVPENPAGYNYYVRTCLQFQQLSAASLFAAKGAVVAAKHRAALYSARLAAQRAIALALAGGGSSSTASAGAATAAAGEVSAAAKAAVARAVRAGGAAAADVAAAEPPPAPAPPALVRARELRGLLATAESGLAEEAALLPEVYSRLLVLEQVDAEMLAAKVEPMVPEGVPDEAEVFALTDVLYPTRPHLELPRGAVAVSKP